MLVNTRIKELVNEEISRGRSMDSLILEAKSIREFTSKRGSDSMDLAVKRAIYESRALTDSGYTRVLVESNLLGLLLGLAKMRSGDPEKEEEGKSEASESKGFFGDLVKTISENIASIMGASGEWIEYIIDEISEMDILDIPKLLVDCDFLANLLFRVGKMYGLSYIKDVLSEDGDSGFFDEMLIALFDNIAEDSAVAETVKDKLSEFICGKFDEFMESVKPDLL